MNIHIDSSRQDESIDTKFEYFINNYIKGELHKLHPKFEPITYSTRDFKQSINILKENILEPFEAMTPHQSCVTDVQFHWLLEVYIWYVKFETF